MVTIGWASQLPCRTSLLTFSGLSCPLCQVSIATPVTLQGMPRTTLPWLLRLTLWKAVSNKAQNTEWQLPTCRSVSFCRMCACKSACMHAWVHVCQIYAKIGESRPVLYSVLWGCYDLHLRWFKFKATCGLKLTHHDLELRNWLCREVAKASRDWAEVKPAINKEVSGTSRKDKEANKEGNVGSGDMWYGKGRPRGKERSDGTNPDNEPTLAPACQCALHLAIVPFYGHCSSFCCRIAGHSSHHDPWKQQAPTPKRPDAKTKMTLKQHKLTEQKAQTNLVMANNTLVEAIMVEYVPAWIMRSHAPKNIEWRRRRIN